jgi:hypothetical protein
MRFTQPDWAEPDLYLMADEGLVDSAAGATFALCPLAKADEPVLRPTEPWEGGRDGQPQPVHQDPLDGSVLYEPDTGLYHLWYRTHNRLIKNCSDPALGDAYNRRGFRTEGSVVCHAVSADGLAWERPPAGRLLYEQSRANNMVPVAVPPVMDDHLSGVLPNYLPDRGSDLVATVYSTYDHPLYTRGITQLYGDDGIDWEPHFPPTLPLDGDAHCLMWNSRERCYMCTTRSAQHATVVRRLQQRGYHEIRAKRHIALAKSADLVHWTPMLDILEADDEDPENAQLYYMYILPYGHLYLGFVQLFYISPCMTFGPLEMQLAVSRDLVNWTRPGGRVPVLPRGPAGSWDSAHVSLCSNPPFACGPDRLRFWYGGKDTEHWQAGNAALGTATLRRDGFACWSADAAGGTVTTVPMNMRWATWPMLSVDAAAGEVRVEVLDAESGTPLPGCSVEDAVPITGNHQRAMVTFGDSRGTFLRHTGAVRFRFHLQNAQLYAFKAPNAAIAWQE